jgi:glyoxylase-like metal-dependent hydrolase (beta-lactamase superfamily II)
MMCRLFGEEPMKRFVLLGALLIAGALSITLTAFQQPAQPQERVIEVDKVKDNLYVLKGGGGNTAVFITAKGVVVVDTKNPGWGQPILDKIKALTDKPVTTIINTHTHGDHVSGNVEFPPTVDVIVQENTKSYMERMDPVYTSQPTGQQENIFKKNDGRGLPKRTFKDTWTMGSGDDQIDLRYFGAAHTGGDAYVIFTKHRVMHVGDTFPTRDLPIMDKNNGGSGVRYSGTLAKAANATNVDTIINGHNPTTMTTADLKLYSEFIGDFVKFVQDAKKAGKTIDDVVNTWRTPAKYTGYNEPTTDEQRTTRTNRVRADAQVIWEETK